ncbi:hypothetical protein Hanom_Chr16g01518771 [Helianthus anomalus]
MEILLVLHLRNNVGFVDLTMDWWAWKRVDRGIEYFAFHSWWHPWALLNSAVPKLIKMRRFNC